MVSKTFHIVCNEMKDEVKEVKPYLIEKLKQEHCLWSYENDSINDIPDDVLVEFVTFTFQLSPNDRLCLVQYDGVFHSRVKPLYVSQQHEMTNPTA